MKIFVSGKGGSGKSTVSALLAKELANRDKKVLVVDNDESNFGLHTLLGLDLPEDFMDRFGGRDEVFDKAEEIREGMGFDDLPNKYLSQGGNLNLLAIGKISEYGEGCACPMNVLSGKFLRKLSLDVGEVLVVDMDAGVEHFGRKVEEGADVILVVVDPTRESIKLSQKITDFAVDIDKPVYYVLNKMDGESEEIVTNELDEDRILGVIPREEDLYKAGLKGDSLDFEFEEVESLVDSLLKRVS